ncbi:hypothetical protein AMJ39_05140 [candidate division TA06 bacterium DG_24]|jgi:hypothetical protein|uniref:Glycerophosphoryl diester phosphodiesterase membrane domain-containing protein n=3 Tax=Bacteria division TA06 TaxID=1156500 RepID=A0A0S8JPK4_UNCT6|nr:MAG: hypothetical protein AMJ39_05140 [candidate division TA06 bacterium DG_24]KPK69088.1 MAG: hypothetical protein AMJ82_06485 [candidate division TA06 bacterium SM23_40]KPL11610.1 MAG: hypothetical protein AMJ71_00065 [candidate division TA06 bacterium SM1_40]
MDYGSLIRRSLRTMWQHPYLWLFGFLAAGGSGFGPIGEWHEKWGEPSMGGWGLPEDWLLPLLLLLIPLIIIIFVGLFILKVISEGGLIRAAREIDGGKRLRFGLVWQYGLVPFWRLLGIELLVLVAIFAVVLMVIVAVAGTIGFGALAGGPAGAGFLLMGAIAVLLLPALACAIAAHIIVSYARRACVIDGAGVVASLARGWETVRNHLWESIAVWLVAFGSSFVYFLLLVTAGIILLVPFVLLFLIHPLFGLVPGAVVAFCYLAVATGVHSTYQHTLWTLTYTDLWGKAAKEGDIRRPELPSG